MDNRRKCVQLADQQIVRRDLLGITFAILFRAVSSPIKTPTQIDLSVKSSAMALGAICATLGRRPEVSSGFSRQVGVRRKGSRETPVRGVWLVPGAWHPMMPRGIGLMAATRLFVLFALGAAVAAKAAQPVRRGPIRRESAVMRAEERRENGEELGFTRSSDNWAGEDWSEEGQYATATSGAEFKMSSGEADQVLPLLRPCQCLSRHRSPLALMIRFKSRLLHLIPGPDSRSANAA
jgi:hypothetical protein